MASHHRTRVWVSSEAVSEAMCMEEKNNNQSTSINSGNTNLRSSYTNGMAKKKRDENDWGWIRAVLLDKSKDSTINESDNGNETWVRILIEDETSSWNGSHVRIADNPSNDFNNNISNNKNNNNFTNKVLMTNDFKNSEPPDDLITLTHLHEPALVYSLRRRFELDIIYTYTGKILLALNPFKILPSLYHQQLMKTHSSISSSSSASLHPHVYGSADSAYRNMMRGFDFSYSNPDFHNIRKTPDQSILVSGESGAGKTVTTKHIMKYLAFLSQQKSSTTNNKKTRHSRKYHRNHNIAHEKSRSQVIEASSSSQEIMVNVEQKILESNPILESFGNARTIRNDNSSRFGKFIQLQFNNKGLLVGANMETYLLEKVRLLSQSEGERNYHIFYMILKSLQDSLYSHTLTDEQMQKDIFFMENYTIEDFAMTNQSGTYDRRDQVDDTEEFKILENAMRMIGFEPDVQKQIFQIVCALLHSSNLTFTSISNDESCIDQNNPHLHPVMSLLGLQVDTFNSALCSFRIEARGEVHIRSLPKRKAEKGLEALIKAIYAALFQYIVDSINEVVTAAPSTVNAYIGVLDIFGFESFRSNSFEQLCINYCNEALQQQFNKYVFKAEQQEYTREGIEWSFIEFPDNQDVLDLIDKKGAGIIPILDDQCKAPGTTDKTFSNDIYRKCKHHSRFQANFRQVGARKFAVRHYAGLVEYDTEGFVEKNKDELPREATYLLESSSNSFVQELGHVHQDSIKSPSSISSLLSTSPRNALLKSASLPERKLSSSLPPNYNMNHSFDGNSSKLPSLSSSIISPSSSNSRAHPSLKRNSNGSSFRSGNSSSSRITVGGQFKNQLHSLRIRIDQTCPHYIRCLKPNDLLVPNDFNSSMIADQLRYAGVLEAVRVSRVGFPQRYTHSQFIQRYCVLSINEVNKAAKRGLDSRTICNQLVISVSTKIRLKQNSTNNGISNTVGDFSKNKNKASKSRNERDSSHLLEQNMAGIQMGNTKVFLRQFAFDQIECMRLTKLEGAVILIQSTLRRYIAQDNYVTMRCGFIMLQSHGRRRIAKKTVQELREKICATKIQKEWRRALANRFVNAAKYIARWAQTHHRGNIGRTKYKRYEFEVYSVVILQCFIRSCWSRARLRELRANAKNLDAVKNERDGLRLKLEMLQKEINGTSSYDKQNHIHFPQSINTLDLNDEINDSDMSDSKSIGRMSILTKELECTQSELDIMKTKYDEKVQQMQAMQSELEHLRSLSAKQSLAPPEQLSKVEEAPEQAKNEISDKLTSERRPVFSCSLSKVFGDLFQSKANDAPINRRLN